jgi:lycopene cyclase domain-containing protein
VGDYSPLAVVAAGGVVGAEVVWLRTALFRRLEHRVTMAIVFAFQVAVDGWLTKLSAPIVCYDPRRLSGARFPWDIPVEDFLFGFALVTTTLLIWVRMGEG